MGKNYRTIEANSPIYEIGDIVTLVHDDKTNFPFFRNLTKNEGAVAIHLSRLEEITFKVGDTVRIVCCAKDMPNDRHAGEVGIIQKITDSERPFYEISGKDVFCRTQYIEALDDDHAEHLAIHMEMTEGISKREEVTNTMQKFNVGDRVLATAVACVPEGEYEVTSSRGDRRITDGRSTCTCASLWKLISAANETMANLTTLSKEQKEGLKPDDQALLELGLINDKLAPTEAGFEYLRKYLFAEHRDVLAVKAKKEVTEIKKELKEKKSE